MRYDFRLPDVGEGISEGEILSWLVTEGDEVEEGDPIAEVSTDKVTIELPSPCSGRIAQLCHAERTVVPVGEVIVVYDRSDDDGPAAHETVQPPTAPVVQPSRSTGTARASSGRLGRVVASPSTRRLALEHGVDLTEVTASGPSGRIMRTDVEAVIEGRLLPTPTAAPAPHREPLTGVRAVAAKHMAASAQTTATATTTFEVFGDRLLHLVGALTPEAERRSIRLTPLAVIAKCVAAALGRHAAFNATVDESTGDLLLHPTVNLGIAVAAPSGLVVPVIRDVGDTTVLGVAGRVADLAARGRDNALALDDLRGGTFTLSSTGSLERATVRSTTPLINLPQTAILWTSRISERPRVRDGVLEAGPVMVCSISFDHRYIDGAMATEFINDLSSYLENPEQALA